MKTRLKGMVKRSLNAANLRISRVRSGRRHTQEQLIKHVANLKFRPNTVIDVGVGYGTPWLYGQFPGAKYLLVEPLEEFEPYLEEISKRYDASYVVGAVATDHGATIGINVNTDMQSSSIFSTDEGSRSEGHNRPIDGALAQVDIAFVKENGMFKKHSSYA